MKILKCDKCGKDTKTFDDANKTLCKKCALNILWDGKDKFWSDENA